MHSRDRRRTASAVALICFFPEARALLYPTALVCTRSTNARMQAELQADVTNFYAQAREKASQAELLGQWRIAEGVESWYDAGVRLPPVEPEPVEPEPVEPEPEIELKEEPPKPKLTASAEASLAAAAVSGLAVLGIDIAGAGVVEHADAALLVGSIALAQVDNEGPVGETLRVVGNVTSFVGREVVAPTVTTAANVYVENELGYKARALLELGIESALYAADPERRAREKAEAEAAAEAARARAQAEAEAEERAAMKEGLPWWSPDKYAP